MSTYTQLLYHIVFSTKHRERTLSSGNRSELYRYITGIIKEKNCHPYTINGVEDHIHIATHIHSTNAIAPFIKDIKLATNYFISRQRIFSNFSGWQEGYAAFTYSFRDKPTLIQYINNQEIHHQYIGFKEELIDLLKEHGVEFNEKYLL